MYVLDNRAQRYKVKKLKGEIDKFIITVGYFNTFLFITAKIGKKNRIKKT